MSYTVKFFSITDDQTGKEIHSLLTYSGMSYNALVEMEVGLKDTVATLIDRLTEMGKARAAQTTGQASNG